ncbi:unnamed protein product [Mytilus edulis]|uniref:B box-type domain-containing protein n=1 Tax=Mytilus edulis TaxID=6550 RepID=A0A8S3TMM7_MYTED|nr:unnamed protein product [Mytilus edulis]
MASSNKTFCGVCETQDVVRDAIFWCPECDEGLCTSCEKYHRASKSSRNHEVTSVDNYQQLPSSIANIKQYCSDHEEKYQHYCSQHETLCCPLCLTSNHRKCDFLAIGEIIKTSKTSAFFDIMEQSIKDMKSNLERIADDRRKNLEDINQQRQRFLTNIKEIREKIKKHLDKLEQNIQQDIQDAEQKAKSQIDRLLSKIADHDTGGKIFEADIQKEEKFMQSLIEDGDLQQLNLQFKIDDKLSKILSLTKMAEMSIITNPPTIQMTTVSDKQAQQMIPKISKTIKDITPTLLARFEIPKQGKAPAITGCTIMPTQQIIFVDQANDRLLIHNENNSFHSEIPVSTWPIDVTCIDENTVAVTHNAEPYHIEIINIADRKIVKRIKTSNMCYGITNIEGRLLYYEIGSGIITADVTDEGTVTTVVKVDGKNNWTYVTTSKDKIYYTNTFPNTVTCCTVTGQKLWEYKDESILNSIHGVTVDNDSNVYVTSNERSRIVVLSPDGKDARQLLEGNGIKQPCGIHFDKRRNILLVTNLYGATFLYNIK